MRKLSDEELAAMSEPEVREWRRNRNRVAFATGLCVGSTIVALVTFILTHVRFH